MTTYLGKSCSFCLPRVPFVNCRQFMYLVISLVVLRAGYGIWLYQFLIIAYLFTLRVPNLALSFYHGSKHTVVRSAWRFSNSSMDHHGKQINHILILWWSKDEDSTETYCDWHLEIPGVSNNTTGTLEQKKTNSIAPVGQATDKKAPAQPTKMKSFMSGPSLSLTLDPPACN